MVTEGFPLVDIGDVNLNDRKRERTNAVVKGYAGVGIGTRIEHYAFDAFEPSLLQAVDEKAFDITLIVA